MGCLHRPPNAEENAYGHRNREAGLQRQVGTDEGSEGTSAPVDQLAADLAALRREFDEFKKRFE